MGITISSKRYSCDVGFGGFHRLRDTVAKKVNDEFYKHYLKLSSPKVLLLTGDKRVDYFNEYDAITRKFVDDNVITVEVANFLYQSDCCGSISRKQSNQVYKLIKDCDDNILLGYTGRSDCAKMSDMKKIFGDKTVVRWS